MREPHEQDEQENPEYDEQCAESEPVQLRELLKVADHHLARELRLALRADSEGEGNLRDRPARDVALDEEIERNLEPVRVQVACLEELQTTE